MNKPPHVCYPDSALDWLIIHPDDNVVCCYEGSLWYELYRTSRDDHIVGVKLASFFALARETHQKMVTQVTAYADQAASPRQWLDRMMSVARVPDFRPAVWYEPEKDTLFFVFDNGDPAEVEAVGDYFAFWRNADRRMIGIEVRRFKELITDPLQFALMFLP